MPGPDAAHREAIEHLDQIIDRDDVWSAMVAILNNRGLRENLVDARREVGVTQQTVADLLSVDVAVIEEFERESFPDPTVAFVARYCRAIGARLDVGIRFSAEEVAEDA